MVILVIYCDFNNFLDQIIRILHNYIIMIHSKIILFDFPFIL